MNWLVSISQYYSVIEQAMISITRQQVSSISVASGRVVIVVAKIFVLFIASSQIIKIKFKLLVF